MFGGLSKLFGSCGRLLWSDSTEPPSSGYDMVNKEDDSAILNEFSPEEEPLSPEDIVVSQPIWLGRTDSIVKNKSTPNLKAASLSNGAGSIYQPTTLSGIRSSKSSENVSVTSTSQNMKPSGSPKSSVVRSNPKKGHSVHVSHFPSVFSSPIVKSGNMNLPKPSGSRNTYKMSKKQKSEEVKLQIVSVV